MIITVDIGNTNVVVGGFGRDDTEPRFVRRLPSDRNWTPEHWQTKLSEMLCDITNIKGSALSSVVPELTPLVRYALETVTGQSVVTVDKNLDTGLVLANYDRSQLGNDRVVDAVAALSRYNAPIAVFDLGTATTLSVLDEAGRFIGGMILPGIRLSVAALSAHASQLPEISLCEPKELLGNDAVSCMQNGAIFGAAAQIDGLAQRVEELLGQPVTVVLTGGLSHLILPHCKHKLYYDEHLQLRGLKYLYNRTMQSLSYETVAAKL